MHEILFRGKGRDNGKWYEGDLGTVAHKRFIDDGKDNARVIPETVGQYTGLTDKNGTKIFEGDIINVYFTDEINKGIVKYSEDTCRFTYVDKCKHRYLLSSSLRIHVIGNIHDNPELLEATK